MTENKDFIDLAADTMLGDMREQCLDEIKHGTGGEPWEKLGETQQRAVVERIEARMRETVAKGVRIIASRGKAGIPAILDTVTIKDGVKAVVKAPATAEAVQGLSEAQGGPVMIVLASASQFYGERQPAKIDLDQPRLDESDGWERP